MIIKTISIKDYKTYNQEAARAAAIIVSHNSVQLQKKPCKELFFISSDIFSKKGSANPPAELVAAVAFVQRSIDAGVDELLILSDDLALAQGMGQALNEFFNDAISIRREWQTLNRDAYNLMVLAIHKDF